MKKQKKVIVIGGGIGGLSAAHELVERGYSVDIYERFDIPGGKARSFDRQPDCQTKLKNPLPAEHGFRFFPGFYRHVIDTMSRIPLDNGKSVADNLVETPEMALAAENNKLIKVPLNRSPFKRLKNFIANKVSQTGFTSNDKPPMTKQEIVEGMEKFTTKLWHVMCSSDVRRDEEYETIGWYKFIDAENGSDCYKRIFGNMSRSLVAANPERASARTNGNILEQMLLDGIRIHSSVDRVLNGPTNKVWIEPWLKYLLSNGCRYFVNCKAQKINCTNGQISSIDIKGMSQSVFGNQVQSASELRLSKDGKTLEPHTLDLDDFQVNADYYVSGLPVEAMWRLIERSKTSSDPSKNNPLSIEPKLQNLESLSKNTAWMSGLVYYFESEIDIAKGHTIFVDPPYAITTISQRQFWKKPGIDGNPLANYGDGNIQGILSVDISDWFGRYEKEDELIKYSRKDVVKKIWQGITASLDDIQLPDYKYAILDPVVSRNMSYESFQTGDDERSIIEILNDKIKEQEVEQNTIQKPVSSDEEQSQFGSGEEFELVEKFENLEPLLINEVNTWSLRPEAYTAIPNLFLASDYVKTHTDLATMEAANEAGRRAVNALLEKDERNDARCKVWKLRKPWILAPLRWLDARRYHQGLPFKPHDGLIRFVFKVLRWYLLRHERELVHEKS